MSEKRTNPNRAEPLSRAENTEQAAQDLNHLKMTVQAVMELTRPWKIATFALIIAWLLTVSGFLWYLQYIG